MNLGEKVRIITTLDYMEKELGFLSEYEKDVDWKAYQTNRSKRLEIERWVENLINSTLDLSKILLIMNREEILETSREILLKIGARIYQKEEEALSFSEFAKIRNTLAHRYLDIKWNDIKRFMQLAPKLYPPFLNYIKRHLESR
ncbi:MAG: HepT-like ribonuclease domain-containing protein [Thermodesulfobacteriota bacterium]